METVGTWQRVCFRKRVGKSWDWFLEQVEDHLEDYLKVLS